jgi:hypothetical protein
LIYDNVLYLISKILMKAELVNPLCTTVHEHSRVMEVPQVPTLSQWFLRLPEIAEELRQLSAPVVDRAVFESVFRVGRRRAIQLLHQFGGYQVGKTFVIDRTKLIERLEREQGGEAFDRERQRKTRILEELERARRLAAARKVKIAVAPDVQERVLSDLPAGIHLRPGELRIEFFGTEDLLRHLFELSQAIVNDYVRFEELVDTNH